MKKQTFLLLFLAVLTQYSIAQSREPSAPDNFTKQVKNYRANQFIRLYFGYSASVVLGDYAETDFNNVESGFAENGRKLTFGLHYNLADNKFLTAEYKVFSHPIDAGSLFSGSGISSQQYNVEDYSIGVVTLGYKYVGNINTEVNFFVNPFIGIGSMQVGRYSFTVPVQGGTASIIQEADRSVETFVYGFNGGLEIWLSDLFSLCLDLGLISSEFEIDAKIEEQSNGVTVFTERVTYNQPFSTFNAGISLGYNF